MCKRRGENTIQGIAEGLTGDLRLPRLLSNDPHDLLSESARGRIEDAFSEGDLIRTRARTAIELRYRSEHHAESFVRYSAIGAAAVELAEANHEAARIVLLAIRNEFQAAGKSGQELRQIMLEELDFAVYNRQLIAVQRDLLWQELELYRYGTGVPPDGQDPERLPLGDEKKATERQSFMAPHIAPTPRKPTMNALADSTGIGQASLSRWHNGRQRLGSVNLGKLAEHLRMDPKKIPN